MSLSGTSAETAVIDLSYSYNGQLKLEVSVVLTRDLSNLLESCLWLCFVWCHQGILHALAMGPTGSWVKFPLFADLGSASPLQILTLNISGKNAKLAQDQHLLLSSPYTRPAAAHKQLCQTSKPHWSLMVICSLGPAQEDVATCNHQVFCLFSIWGTCFVCLHLSDWNTTAQQMLQ